MSCPIGMQLRLYNNWDDKASMPSYINHDMVENLQNKKLHKLHKYFFLYFYIKRKPWKYFTQSFWAFPDNEVYTSDKWSQFLKPTCYWKYRDLFVECVETVSAIYQLFLWYLLEAL